MSLFINIIFFKTYYYVLIKFNKLYAKPMNDNEIDNDEYSELDKVYEEYKNSKKNKLSIFLN